MKNKMNKIKNRQQFYKDIEKTYSKSLKEGLLFRIKSIRFRRAIWYSFVFFFAFMFFKILGFGSGIFYKKGLQKRMSSSRMANDMIQHDIS